MGLHCLLLSRLPKTVEKDSLHRVCVKYGYVVTITMVTRTTVLISYGDRDDCANAARGLQEDLKKKYGKWY